MRKTLGFTLIELLIVVLLVVILSGIMLVVVNPATLRGRARDAQRVADLKVIQTALESYYLAKRGYPSSSTSYTAFNILGSIRVTGSDRMSQFLTGASVIDKVPADPLGGTSGNVCSNSGDYRYNYLAPARVGDLNNADKYILSAIMEVKSSNDGHECGRLTNWPSNLCGGTPPAGYTCPGNGVTNGSNVVFETCDVCYGVENK